MKPLLLSHGDINGGAARAAFRLHESLLKTGIPSRMHVATKHSDLHTIYGSENKQQKLASLLRSQVGIQLMRLQKSPNPVLHSPAWLSSGLVKKFNADDADVINLHWICGEFLSVEDIGRLTKPLIWTMHDMWPFCGAEHYNDDSPNARWRLGYHSQNRSPNHKGIDLDRWTWIRKRRAWQSPIHLVTPSQWLADCA
ncbi:glycosyltransferase [Neosynechococcus sphagnicola]|uniref:glycosyltransferase n=1 Tax=Neosynechococcus sphagnicola TaxID=1501145 RepID=UPI001EF9CF11|nr:glycosyltransferase [Neosynechococcus sphagnicola]